MLLIKKIETEDVERISQLEKEGFSDPWSVAGIRESLEQTYTILLGAWLSETLVGYVICYCVSDEAEIARIAVGRSFRRQGVATMLLEELKDICLKRQSEKILLDVRKSNEAAAGFYEKCGFTRDGLRKNYYREPTEDAVLMSFQFGK